MYSNSYEYVLRVYKKRSAVVKNALHAVSSHEMIYMCDASFFIIPIVRNGSTEVCTIYTLLLLPMAGVLASLKYLSPLYSCRFICTKEIGGAERK